MKKWICLLLLAACCTAAGCAKAKEPAEEDCTVMLSTPGGLEEALPGPGAERLAVKTAGGGRLTAEDFAALREYIKESGTRVLDLTGAELENFSLPDGAFTGLASLVEILLPASTVRVGERAFLDCASLAALRLPDAVSEIGENAFLGCTALAGLTLGKNVANLSGSLFLQTAIERFAVSEHNPRYRAEDGVLFTKDGRKLVAFPSGRTGGYAVPEGTEEIGEAAFSESDLSEISLGGVKRIGAGAFSKCGQLEEILLPDSVEQLGESAFSGCVSLRLAKIGNGLDSLPDYAFTNCGALAEVRLGRNVRSLGTWALSMNVSLARIAVDEQNPVLAVRDGMLIDTETGTLLQYPLGDARASVGVEGVSAVADYAFAQAPNLKRVVLGECVERVGNFAFAFCRSVESLQALGAKHIGNGAFSCMDLLSKVELIRAVSIGEYAFRLCTSLSGVRLPDSLSAVGDGAFSFCMSLTEVALGRGVSYLGESLFEYCRELKSLRLGGMTPPQIEEDTLPAGLRVYVPAGAKANYEASPLWSGAALTEED